MRRPGRGCGPRSLRKRAVRVRSRFRCRRSLRRVPIWLTVGPESMPGERVGMMTGQRKAAASGAVRDIEVRAADGLMLRGRWWRRAEPRGVVVITHGFGEHG